MAGWMLYVTGVAGALCLAGLLAEHGVRCFGRPVRWVWVCVLAATVGLPVGLALAGGGSGPARGERVALGAAPDAFMEPGIWTEMARAAASSMADSILLVAWFAVSLVLLANLRLSAWTLRRNERSWRARRVAGHRVFVSAGFGPGVVGTLRSRIVFPRWLLDWDEPLQRLIVLHELEHVRAGDGRLLLGGLILAMLVPWCLPLWWQLHRLRAAIEMDCDDRVLAAQASAREYARVLVAVAGRRTRPVLPIAALDPERAELERRIRRITEREREESRARGVGLLAAAGLVALALGIVPAPAPPNPALPNPVLPGVTVSVEPVRVVALRDGSLPGAPSDERVAAEVRAHHGAALARGLSPGSIIWFVIGDEDEVRRTGIARGTEDEVTERIRARYPEETSDFVFAFEGVPVDSARVRVLWLIPSPAA